MKTEYVTLYGKTLSCDEGQTIVPDHHEMTFVVTVRSMRFLSEEAIKNLLQSLYEVTRIEATHHKCIVAHVGRD